MRELAEIKVVLQSPEGKYLAGSGINPCLVKERSRAIVLDYFADHVEHKIATILQNSGIAFQPVALPSKEVYETCDGCQCLLMPREIYFDGCHFLCRDCKTEAYIGVDPKRLAA